MLPAFDNIGDRRGLRARHADTHAESNTHGAPGQPASRLHPHALVRAAFAAFSLDRRGLRGRSRDGQAHGSLTRTWARPVRRWASRGARERNTSPKHRTSAAPLREHQKVSVLKWAPRPRLALHCLVRRGKWRVRAVVDSRDHRRDANDVSQREAGIALVRTRGPVSFVALEAGDTA